MIALAVGVVLMVALPAAQAHDPIFIADDQTTPDSGPFMPDGSISWALYGQVLSAGDTRGFEFDLRDGEELYISLLIPNLEPELSLTDGDLPIVELESPDGSSRTLTAEVREVFDEEFSRTSYVTLHELREPAQAGRYRGVVVGSAPSRFTIAIGETEIFFTETERSGDRPSNFMEISAPLNAWYSTPPGGEPTGETAAGEAEIDLDRIEEAMGSGEGEIAEGGSLRGDESTDKSATQAPSAATSAVAADEGGSNGWVAPVVIGAVVILGGGAFLARRRGADDAA